MPQFKKHPEIVGAVQGAPPWGAPSRSSGPRPGRTRRQFSDWGRGDIVRRRGGGEPEPPGRLGGGEITGGLVEVAVKILIHQILALGVLKGAGGKVSGKDVKT